jgi:pSer/pThr/pTyr-binding forkhead associated (FHA) protein
VRIFGRCRTGGAFLIPLHGTGTIAVNHAPLEQFLSACGSPEPLRVGVGQRDQLLSDTWTFRQPFLVIGRRPDSDLPLDHWQVSRRHAYLQLIEGRYFCVDLGSRTGTHGGDASERFGWLERGRAIEIGPFTVRPEWPEQARSEAPPMPVVTWELPGRAIGQSLWRMDRHLALIGRSPACRIRIVQPDVSKFHCGLVLTPMGVWAVDLLGQNGIFVNDEPVRFARLEEGDVLRVGSHLLRPRYNAEPPPLAPPGPIPPGSTGGELATYVPSPGAIRAGEPAAPMLTRPIPSWSSTAREIAGFGEGPTGIADPTVGALVHQFGLMQQQMFDQFHQTMMMMFEGFAALHREQASGLHEEFDQVRKLSEEIESLRRETARLADQASRPAPLRPRPTNGHSPPVRSTGQEGPASLRPPDPTIKRATMPEPDPNVDIHSQLLLRLSTIQSERQTRWQKILGMMSSKS